MNKLFEQIILESTRAQSFSHDTHIQSLWSGYGSIDRLSLNGGKFETAILKHIRPEGAQSRGVTASHQRKLKSYQIETTWYKEFAHLCDESCRIPHYIASARGEDNEQIILLEDLDAAGYNLRCHAMTKAQELSCISWMANFHATFLNCTPSGLWNIGTYWHLDTRQEELRAMRSGRLKSEAADFDKELNRAKYKTIIHGDAKAANFCLSPDNKIAAVDFQYVGGGCGMKDLVYFLWGASQRAQNAAIDSYFIILKQALADRSADVNFNELEAEWRKLYPIASDDFERFLQGWMC